MLRNLPIAAVSSVRCSVLNEVLSLNAQEYQSGRDIHVVSTILLNEVLSLNAQESSWSPASTRVRRILNEVLSLNAQESCILPSV